MESQRPLFLLPSSVHPNVTRVSHVVLGPLGAIHSCPACPALRLRQSAAQAARHVFLGRALPVSPRGRTDRHVSFIPGVGFGTEYGIRCTVADYRNSPSSSSRGRRPASSSRGGGRGMSSRGGARVTSSPRGGGSRFGAGARDDFRNESPDASGRESRGGFSRGAPSFRDSRDFSDNESREQTRGSGSRAPSFRDSRDSSGRGSRDEPRSFRESREPRESRGSTSRGSRDEPRSFRESREPLESRGSVGRGSRDEPRSFRESRGSAGRGSRDEPRSFRESREPRESRGSFSNESRDEPRSFRESREPRESRDEARSFNESREPRESRGPSGRGPRDEPRSFRESRAPAFRRPPRPARDLDSDVGSDLDSDLDAIPMVAEEDVKAIMQAARGFWDDGDELRYVDDAGEEEGELKGPEGDPEGEPKKQKKQERPRVGKASGARSESESEAGAGSVRAVAASSTRPLDFEEIARRLAESESESESEEGDEEEGDDEFEVEVEFDVASPEGGARAVTSRVAWDEEEDDEEEEGGDELMEDDEDEDADESELEAVLQNDEFSLEPKSPKSRQVDPAAPKVDLSDDRNQKALDQFIGSLNLKRLGLAPTSNVDSEKQAAARKEKLREERAKSRQGCQYENVRFMRSAMTKRDWPTMRSPTNRLLPEIVVTGRANAGKSSLLNDLFRSPGLARTSSTPGETRSLDFFNVDGRLSFVDVPGYGFSVVPEEERLKWPEMMLTYYAERRQLKLYVLLIDMRLVPEIHETAFRDWIEMSKKPGILVLTKADLVPPQHHEKQKALITEALKWKPDNPVVFYSVVEPQGREELSSLIDHYALNFPLS